MARIGRQRLGRFPGIVDNGDPLVPQFFQSELKHNIGLITTISYTLQIASQR